MKKLHAFAGIITLQLFSMSEIFADLPENNLHLEDGRFRKSTSMTEERFNELIDQASSIYTPIFSGHGATLVWERNWNDSTVNAYASQSGNNWKVAMYGGLARRPEVTEDGFSLVICHEIGHHLAGFPLYGSGDWAASEGQSDYYASETCAKKLWKDQLEVNARFRETVHPLAKEVCDEVWTDTNDQNLCYRTSMAGHSLADLLASIASTPSEVAFETPSSVVVESTMTSHPPAQCRLDTYWAGALCDRSIPDDLIPGKSASNDAEATAGQHSCTSAEFFYRGVRPLCWFKPKLPNMLALKDLVWESLSGGTSAIEPGESFNLKAVIQNNSSQDLNNIDLKLSSPISGVSVSADNAFLATLMSQASSGDQDKPFVVNFGSELACGAEVKLNLGVTLNSKRKGMLVYETALGTKQTSPLFEETNSTKIPDLDKVVSELAVSGVENGPTLNLKMKIKHSYFRDLRYKLESPNGKVFDFTLTPPSNNGTHELTKQIKVPETTPAGNWKLTISDEVARDEGELQNWSLQFETYVCSL